MITPRLAPYLTASQIDQFHRKGFLVLENMVSQDQLEQLKARANQLVKELEADWHKAIFSTRDQVSNSNDYFLTSGEKIRVFMEEKQDESVGHRVNKIGHALHDRDEVFYAFSHQEVFDRIACDIGLENPGLIQSMYIFKQPRIGGEVNVHQDATFLYTEPVSVTGFWFAVQDATLDNGCLWALPGGHQLGLKNRFMSDGKQTSFQVLDVAPLPEEGYVPLEVKAGTLVLLHGLLPHYSEANRSEQPRQAYALHVIDREAHYPADNWLRRETPPKGFM